MVTRHANVIGPELVINFLPSRNVIKAVSFHNIDNIVCLKLARCRLVKYNTLAL